MKLELLLVFDDRVQGAGIKEIGEAYGNVRVKLFPLTGNGLVIKRVKEVLAANGCRDVDCCNAAEVVNTQVNYLQEKISGWSVAVGESRVLGRMIKEWFCLPGGVSAWWLSLLSEKNTLKTSAFLQLSQVNAIKNVVDEHNFTVCLLALEDRILCQAITNVCKKKGLPVKYLVLERPEGFRKRTLKAWVKASGPVGAFLGGLYIWARFLSRGYCARRQLGPRQNRLPLMDSLLFVSYFPAVDKKAAEKGIFCNRYSLALQEKFAEKNLPVTWLLMIAALDGYSYAEALKLAYSFKKYGERLFVLEEFTYLRDALVVLLLWFRQVLLSPFLYLGLIKGKALFHSSVVDAACEPIIRHLWVSSFCGFTGMEGIVYYYSYRRVFKELPQMKDCLYYCEMQAWEKALNAAKNLVNPTVRTVGFQHSTISRNYFFYAYDRSELAGKGKPDILPLPDVLACNGEFNCSLLREYGYPQLYGVEAVRYTYLHALLSQKVPAKNNKPLLLIAGSIDRAETRQLLVLANAAFPRVEKISICFKGHPVTSFETLFAEAGINPAHAGYEIGHGNIADFLHQAWAVLVPTSTVAIEALAFGCEVIVPLFPNAMLMNPLADFDYYYHKVTSPDELREVMEKIAGGERLRSVEEYRDFVRKYWYLDPELPRWERLFGK